MQSVNMLRAMMVIANGNGSRVGRFFSHGVEPHARVMQVDLDGAGIRASDAALSLRQPLQIPGIFLRRVDGLPASL